jgi:Tol biopolymer transport system component
MSPASASVSADGRYVALVSFAALTAADLDGLPDIYLLDRATNRLSLESNGSNNPRAVYSQPRLSASGRYLAFEETLPAPQRRFIVQLVVRDRLRDVRTLVAEGVPDGWIGSGALSDDGRVLAFASSFTNLTRGPDGNGDVRDVYILNSATGVIERASVDNRGEQPAKGESLMPGVSGSGRYVVFTSTADFDRSTQPGGDDTRTQERFARIYVRDSHLNVTRCISGGAGTGATRGSSYDGVISRDGRYVAFVSEDSTLVAGDRNRTADVLLYDTVEGTMILVSRSAAGGSANGASRSPAISADGRFVTFQSEASDLVCASRCASADEDINLLPDIFLFDRTTGVMKRISAGPAGGWMEDSVAPAISAAGDVIAFSSRRPIDRSDIDNDFDLFIHVPIPARNGVRQF